MSRLVGKIFKNFFYLFSFLFSFPILISIQQDCTLLTEQWEKASDLSSRRFPLTIVELQWFSTQLLV